MVTYRVALVAFLCLAGFGCEEELDCRPCKNTENSTCADVKGTVAGRIQISEGSCEVPWGGQGQVSVTVVQSQETRDDDEYSKLIITILWSAGGLMILTLDGELCDTSDFCSGDCTSCETIADCPNHTDYGCLHGLCELFPKKYPFFATSQDNSDDMQVSYSVGGDFIVYAPGADKDDDYCGAISIVASTPEESCSTGAVIYSSEDSCE